MTTLTEAVAFPVCQCQRCRYRWIARSLSPPKACPQCRSRYWEKPKQDRARRHAVQCPLCHWNTAYGSRVDAGEALEEHVRARHGQKALQALLSTYGAEDS